MDYANYQERDLHRAYLSELLNERMQRSRSRSSSAAPKRRSIARSRSVPARSLVPRSLRYNGVNMITRMSSNKILISGLSGTDINNGTNIGTAFGIKFSPTGFTLVKTTQGGVVNSFTEWPGAEDFTNLYEQVKIDKIELTFAYQTTPKQTTNPVLFNSKGAAPHLYVCNDTDDLDDIGILKMQQQEGCRVLSLGDEKPHKHSVVPKFSQLVYFTGGTTSSRSATGYVPTGENIPHYGVRVLLDLAYERNAQALVDTQEASLNIFVKAFFSLKNVQ